MALGVIELIGDDVLCTVSGRPESRHPAEGAVARLSAWSGRYERATRRHNEAELTAIGREMFAWLDDDGWGSAWADGQGERVLEIRVHGRGDDREAKLLDAPWELLAADGGALALDALRLFIVARRIGPPQEPLEPHHGDLQLMFMAASPEGPDVLDFEAEEAAILEATRGGGRVHVVVEETGALAELGERLTADEGPFEALHLSCHGDLAEGGDPVLLLETAEGDQAPAGPGAVAAAFGAATPPLVVLSACRTAEAGSELTAPFARQLATLVANVVGWDGSVYDRDATDFAAVFYAELGRGSPVARAAAVGRRALLTQKAGDPQRGQHWHLARVYLGPGGGGALCAAGRPRRPGAAAQVERAFLDKAKQRVPVAARQAFVGRRRVIQSVLRAFRDAAPGVLIHGMGALGKSSLAARVASRTALRPVVIFGRYDALAIVDEVLAALPAVERQTNRDTWRERVKGDPSALAEALESWLEGPLDAQPILIIVDDLERILEKPTPGDDATKVAPDYRAALGAVLTAFGRSQTRSRLLLTSRYDFRLPDGRGGDLAEDLVRVPLGPMPARDRMKQLRAAERLAQREEAVQDQAVQALLSRALAAAGGNPGLQAVLTTPILAGEIAAAEEALRQIGVYRETGVPPAEIEALIAAGTAKDSENALIAFFGRLSFATYRAALTPDQTRQLSAATLFSDGIPIPRAALEAAGAALGVEAPAAAVARLLGLGLLDDWGAIAGVAHAAANALARPLAPTLDLDDRPRLARAALPSLAEAWRDAREEFPVDTRGLEVATIALAAGAEPALLEDAVLAGGTWLARVEARNREALTLITKALAALPADQAAGPEFVRLGIECATLLGETQSIETLLAAPVRPPATDDPPAAVAHAMLDLRRAERLLETGQVETAEALTRSALSMSEGAADDFMVAVANGQIANILQARGELDEALRIRRQEQLPVYERHGDVRERAVTLGKIADILQARGDLDEALRIYREEQLPVFERRGAVRERAVTMGRIAYILQARGELDEALRIRRQEELPVFERLGAVRDRAVALGKIADILQARGDLDEALRIRREEELPVYEHLGAVRERAVTLQRIAAGLLQGGGLEQGRIQEIHDALAESFAIARDLGLPDGVGAVGLQLAPILALGGHREEALGVLDEAEAAFHKLGDHQAVEHVKELRTRIRNTG